MLTTEQWLLKKYLEDNFEYGKWFSIEEIVDNVCYSNGEKVFTLNTNPKCHDKCIKLSNMVKDINWDCEEGQKLIIKNKQGGIKLAETKQEFDGWRDAELKKLETKWKYLNNLKWKASRDGDIPIYNQKQNLNTESKSVEVYMNKFWAIKCYSKKTIWVVKCDDITFQGCDALVIGGRFNQYHCPCDRVYQVASVSDAITKNYKIVDLTY